MIIVVYSKVGRENLELQLGEADYSYRFVLESYLPVLEKIGTVVDLSGAGPSADPGIGADAVYDMARTCGEECVFLCFTPPHKAPTGLRCPTICVFAWEFEDLPTMENGAPSPQHDWGRVLGSHGRAITHSAHTASVARRVLGQDFPIAVIPAPVWDGVAPNGSANGQTPVIEAFELEFDGEIFIDPSPADPEHVSAASGSAEVAFEIDLSTPSNIPIPTDRRQTLALDGVVYATVLNPNDSRKNWSDLVNCFCLALGDKDDATLVLKVVQSGPFAKVRRRLRTQLMRLPSLGRRIVLLNAHLDDASYHRLLASSTYGVNCSLGEGQCIPLMEMMSAGRPVVAPAHSGLSDYVNETNAFVVDTSLEPTGFPHLEDAPLATWRRRMNARSLYDAFQESYRVAKQDPEHYAEMSRNASATLRCHASAERCETGLRSVIRQPAMSVAEDASEDLPVARDTAAEVRAEVEKRVFSFREDSTVLLNTVDELALESSAAVETDRGEEVENLLEIDPLVDLDALGEIDAAEDPDSLEDSDPPREIHSVGELTPATPLHQPSELKLSFVVAGFSKCATTTVTAALGAHPDVYAPLDEVWHFGLHANIFAQSTLSVAFADVSSESTLGFCNVLTANWRNGDALRENLSQVFPDIKTILIARDPLDRVEAAYREYHNSWTEYGIKPPPFSVDEALRTIPEMIPDSLYGCRFRGFTERFPRENIKMVFFEDLIARPSDVMKELFAFLEVDAAQASPVQLDHLNARDEKLFDTQRFRTMRDILASPETAYYATYLPRKIADQFLVPLGLRRPFTGEPLPGWGPDEQRDFVSRIEDDIYDFLELQGRDSAVWPRFASLTGGRSA